MAAILLPLLTACWHDPQTDAYSMAKPELKDMIGLWTPTDSTLQSLSITAYSKARPRIELLADGLIRMTDIPDTWRLPLEAGSGEAENFLGTWELAKYGESSWGFVLRRDEWTCVKCLMVLGQKSPYRLVLRIGRPAFGLGIEFEKAD
jgi:hypothetical protein